MKYVLLTSFIRKLPQIKLLARTKHISGAYMRVYCVHDISTGTTRHSFEYAKFHIQNQSYTTFP